MIKIAFTCLTFLLASNVLLAQEKQLEADQVSNFRCDNGTALYLGKEKGNQNEIVYRTAHNDDPWRRISSTGWSILFENSLASGDIKVAKPGYETLSCLRISEQ